MKLKYQLTTEELEALDESVRSLYTDKDGTYVLAVEGIPEPEDTGALKRAKDHEKEARKQAEAKAKELEVRLRDLEDTKSRDRGDVKSLEESYQRKLQELETKARQENEKLTSIIKRNTVEAEARRLAAELSGPNADIILPHILQRMSVELDDEGPRVRVLDEKGVVTADTPEDLKNYFFTNQRYSPIIIGSKATGSGAAGAKSGGGVHKKLSEMTATEEALFAKQNPQKYQQMLEQES